jgi:hypothetical protein
MRIDGTALNITLPLESRPHDYQTRIRWSRNRLNQRSMRIGAMDGIWSRQ